LGALPLLLHGEGEYQGGGRLFKIISDGPRVFSKEKLLELGYPGGGGQPYYLVYDVGKSVSVGIHDFANQEDGKRVKDRADTNGVYPDIQRPIVNSTPDVTVPMRWNAFL
jgi:hypothetical protein